MMQAIFVLKKTFDHNLYPKLILLIGVIYLLFAPIEIMDIDAAQYASISREMLDSKSFLQVFQREKDYLDKPPLLFWLASCSFQIFGVHTISYKLPAVLILLLGLFSTFKAAKLFYEEKVAGAAMLIVASMQAYFLMVNDIRTDGILSGFCIFSIWQFLSYIQKKNTWNFLLGSIGIGFAMLSKGPIGAIIPAMAIGSQLLFTKNFKQLFHPIWLLIPIIVLIILSPMLYGLYQQFDLHPEKEVYGLQGPSGIKFFFWTQSFGRITGDIYWKDESSPFFFLQSLAWDAQPWFAIGIIAFIYSSITILKSFISKQKPIEYWSYFGFIIPFIALSTSQYKLPHYVFPLLPYLAILISHFYFNSFETFSNKIKNSIYIIQSIPIVAFPLLVCLISLYVFPLNIIWLLLLLTIYAFSILIVRNLFSDIKNRIFYQTVFTSFWGALFLALHFYPSLLQYQGTGKIGKWASENNIPKDKLYAVDVHSFSYDFYAKRITPFVSLEQLDQLPKGTYISVKEESKIYIEQYKIDKYIVVQKFPNYSVTILRPGFLNIKSREQYLEYVYILQKQ